MHAYFLAWNTYTPTAVLYCIESLCVMSHKGTKVLLNIQPNNHTNSCNCDKCKKGEKCYSVQSKGGSWSRWRNQEKLKNLSHSAWCHSWSHDLFLSHRTPTPATYTHFIPFHGNSEDHTSWNTNTTFFHTQMLLKLRKWSTNTYWIESKVSNWVAE